VYLDYLAGKIKPIQPPKPGDDILKFLELRKVKSFYDLPKFYQDKVREVITENTQEVYLSGSFIVGNYMIEYDEYLDAIRTKYFSKTSKKISDIDLIIKPRLKITPDIDKVDILKIDSPYSGKLLIYKNGEFK